MCLNTKWKLCVQFNNFQINILFITIQIGCALWDEKCNQRDITSMLIDKIDTSVFLVGDVMWRR